MQIVLVPMLAILISASVSCSALDVLVNQTGYECYAPKVFRAQRATDNVGNSTDDTVDLDNLKVTSN